MAKPPRQFVILPGLDGTGRFAEPFLQVTPAAWSCHVLKFPTDRILSYAGLADDARTKLPTGEPFVLIAESFGGPLALLLASDPPENLAAVVLVATFLKNPIRPLPRWLGRLAARFAGIRPPKFVLRQFLLTKSLDDPAIDDVLHQVRTMPTEVLAVRIREMIDVDAVANYQNCRVPLLVLNAQHDKLIGRQVRDEFRALRPDVDVVEIDGPHLLLHECPTESLQAIVNFLTDHRLL